MSDLFDKSGGFRRLHTFTLATIIQLDTFRFCRQFLTRDPREAGKKSYDPQGRQYDQMTQAARSSRQNIIEGSERSATHLKGHRDATHRCRTGQSRELRGDYEICFLAKGQLP